MLRKRSFSFSLVDSLRSANHCAAEDDCSHRRRIMRIIHCIKSNLCLSSFVLQVFFTRSFEALPVTVIVGPFTVSRE